MFLSNNELVKLIKETDKIIIYGLSNKTKLMIDKYKFKNIVCIVDKDPKKVGSTYKKIPINPICFLDDLESNIILWGNHVFSIFNELKKYKSLTYYISIEDFIRDKDSKISFKLEVPRNPRYDSDLNFLFSKKIASSLMDYHSNVKIEPVEYGFESHTQNREIKSNEILFSYHSIGEKNYQIIRWKEGYLANMITFDYYGYSGWSSLCDKSIENLLENVSTLESEQFFQKFSKEYIQKNQSKYSQPLKTNFSFPKKFIFFPLQVLDDSVMKHSYFEPIKLIEDVIEILNKKNIALVIKKHPRCINKDLNKKLIKYEKQAKLILYNGSIHEAISKATTIYVINSGVGFESLLHLKPVVTFGRSDYMNITKNINDLEKIKKDPFYKLNENKKQEIKKFLFYYINNNSVFLDDSKKLDEIVKKYVQKAFN